MRSLLTVVAGLVLVVLALVGVVLSPLALDVLAANVQVDTARVSGLGGSYGAVSALLSALALCVVAISAILQVRQVQVGQLHAARSLQIDLLRVALENPEYRVVLGEEMGALAAEEWRRHAYLNLWMMYLQMTYLTGGGDDRAVRRSLAGEFFSGDIGQQFWLRARPAYAAEARTARHRRFLRIADQAYLEAISRRAESAEGAAGKTSPEVEPPMAPRATASASPTGVAKVQVGC